MNKLQKTNYYKKLKQPIYYLQWILITFSIVALMLLTKAGFKLPFEFTTNGFQNYLGLYEPYSVLFAATFIVITAHLAIERLGLMSEANTTSFKVSNRTLWMQIVKEFFSEIRDEDPYLCKEIMRNLINIHDYLFDKGYKFSNDKETTEFFEKFLRPRVRFFEEMNTKYMNIACYSDKTQSYSWMNMRYLIFAMINIDESYQGFLTDLQSFYQVEVLKFSSQFIDKEMFSHAAKNYYDRKLKGLDIK